MGSPKQVSAGALALSGVTRCQLQKSSKPHKLGTGICIFFNQLDLGSPKQFSASGPARSGVKRNLRLVHLVYQSSCRISMNIVCSYLCVKGGNGPNSCSPNKDRHPSYVLFLFPQNWRRAEEAIRGHNGRGE